MRALSDHETAVVTRYAEQYGKAWKDALGHHWANEYHQQPRNRADASTLRSIRNNPQLSFDWLKACKISVPEYRAERMAETTIRLHYRGSILGHVVKDVDGWRARPNMAGRRGSKVAQPSARAAAQAYFNAAAAKAIDALDQATPAPTKPVDFSCNGMFDL